MGSVVKSKGPVSIPFGNFSLGLNTADPVISLRDGEFQDALNAIVKKIGFKRSPGYRGLKSTAMFATYIKLLEIYKQYDGTEKLMCLSNGKIYEVTVGTGDITERYDLTGTGEGWGLSFLNKFWLANGTEVAKVENETGYQVGIDAPTGATAAPLAGGSLPAGVYKIYVCYGRTVTDGLLYSVGQSIADVTLSGGNGSIRVTMANSADPQVNNKIVFMTDADEVVYYRYYQTLDNTTTQIDITDATQRNNTLLYSVVAANNQRPPALEWIHSHDNRLIGGVGNKVHYSLKASVIADAPVLDLEKWPTKNFYNYPYDTDGAFSLREHLYFNSAGGIIMQPYGDFTTRYEIMEQRLYFKSMRTVREYNGVVWGLTNDGFRFFDGQKFSPDLSRQIRPLIDELYNDQDTNLMASGGIKRRGALRTEYQLSFYNNEINQTTHNRTLVLNLDNISILGNNEVIAPWEIWQHGHGYFAVTDDNISYYGQSLNGASTIYKESTTAANDQYIYGEAGTFLSVATNKKSFIKSRTLLIDPDFVIDWYNVQLLIRMNESGKLTVYISDRFNIDDENTVSPNDNAGTFILDLSKLDVDSLPSEIAEVIEEKLHDNMKGKLLTIQMEQEKNDTVFEVSDIKINGIAEKGRYT